MRLPRMTTRRWMAAVAIIAAVLVVGLCWKRRAFYLALADDHALRARMWDVRKRPLEEPPFFRVEFYGTDGTMKEPYASQFAALSGYYAGLERKYRTAAARPWMPVEADAPMPQRPAATLERLHSKPPLNRRLVCWAMNQAKGAFMDNRRYWQRKAD